MVIATVKFVNAYDTLKIHRSQVRIEQVPVADPEQRLQRQDVSLGRYSGRCTYHKMQYVYTYCSFAAVKRGGRTVIYTGPKGKSLTHKVPAAWKVAVNPKDGDVELRHRTHADQVYRIDADDLLTHTAWMAICNRCQGWCDADHPAIVIEACPVDQVAVSVGEEVAA